MKLKSWTLGRLNHVAIACPNLANTSQFYKNILHATVSEPVVLPEHGVTTVFVEMGNIKIEVDNLCEAVMEVRSKNIRTLEPAPTVGAHGKPVIFLHPKDCGGVLIELEQA